MIAIPKYFVDSQVASHSGTRASSGEDSNSGAGSSGIQISSGNRVVSSGITTRAATRTAGRHQRATGNTEKAQKVERYHFFFLLSA